MVKNACHSNSQVKKFLALQVNKKNSGVQKKTFKRPKIRKTKSQRTVNQVVRMMSAGCLSQRNKSNACSSQPTSKTSLVETIINSLQNSTRQSLAVRAQLKKNKNTKQSRCNQLSRNFQANERARALHMNQVKKMCAIQKERRKQNEKTKNETLQLLYRLHH